MSAPIISVLFYITGSESEIIEHLRHSLQFHECDADALSQIHVNGHVQMIE